MSKIRILDKEFAVSISRETIDIAVRNVAGKMNHDLLGKDVVFLGVLNGSFMFIADLMRYVNIPCEISFIKVASYSGTQSSGVIRDLIGLNENMTGRCVVVVEDIVDTGETLEYLLTKLKDLHPAEVYVATCLFKPAAFRKEFKVDYCGMEIPNDFIVGYGLDYNGYGRNLPEIYTLVKS